MRLEVLHTNEEIEAGLQAVAERIANDILLRTYQTIAALTVCDGGIHVSSFLQKALSEQNISILRYTCNSTGYQGDKAGKSRNVRLNLTPEDVEQITSSPDMLILIADDMSDSGLSLLAIQEELFKLGIQNETRYATLYSRVTENGKKHPDYYAYLVDGDAFLLGYGLDYKNLGGSLEFVVKLILDSPTEQIAFEHLKQLIIEIRQSLSSR